MNSSPTPPQAEQPSEQPTLDALIDKARTFVMTPEQQEQQRQSFVRGNLEIDRPTPEPGPSELAVKIAEVIWCHFHECRVPWNIANLICAAGLSGLEEENRQLRDWATYRGIEGLSGNNGLSFDDWRKIHSVPRVVVKT